MDSEPTNIDALVEHLGSVVGEERTRRWAELRPQEQGAVALRLLVDRAHALDALHDLSREIEAYFGPALKTLGGEEMKKLRGRLDIARLAAIDALKRVLRPRAKASPTNKEMH